MRLVTLTACLAALVLGGLSPPAEAQLPGGRGVLLPLQDRVGDARFAGVVEVLLQRELEACAALGGADSARGVLRSLRVRDASDEAPDRLVTLADRLEAEWFFLPTLHEVAWGRASQRPDGIALGGVDLARDGIEDPRLGDVGRDDASDSPQVVLSALVLRPDSPEIWWAGFEAASGRDGVGLFGLGEIETLEELTEGAVRALVARSCAPRSPGRKARLRHGPEGYLRSSNAPAPPARIAVIPMDSVATQEGGVSAEVATAALLAALDDFGFKPLLPGLVRAIRQEAGPGRRGAASRPEWEALAREGGAGWVATGTVETYRQGRGRTPDPWVAFSVRLLDAGDGRIGWLDGLERRGGDTSAAFDRRRIYSTGGLTYEMMRSMFGAMRAASGTVVTARGS